MFRFPTCFLMLSLFLVLVVSAGCSKSPVDRAQAFLDAGMASQALPLLQIEIQSNPKNARAHLMVGQASLMLNDRAAAKESFARAVLLNPSWTGKVARCYLDAANTLISSDPSETGLAISYLETAREQTHALDKDVARSLRRVGLQVGSAEILRSAVQTDAVLAKDDSVAGYLAVDLAQVPEQRMEAMQQFLAEYPRSGLRPSVLVEIARQEVVAGNRPKAKAYAEEAANLAADQRTKDGAGSLLREIAGAEQAEKEVGAAAQRAELEAQQTMVRLKLQEQEAKARSAGAQASMQAAQAESRARSAAEEASRQAREAAEDKRRVEELGPLLAMLHGKWRFTVEQNGLLDGYIDFQRVQPNGTVSGEFVFPSWQWPRNRFTGMVRGTEIELTRDCTPPGGIIQKWTGTIDVEARTITGDGDGGRFAVRK